MKESPTSIRDEVHRRKLMQAITPQQDAFLRQHGASTELLKEIERPEFIVAPAVADAVRQRQAKERARHAASEPQNQPATAHTSPQHNVEKAKSEPVSLNVAIGDRTSLGRYGDDLQVVIVDVGITSVDVRVYDKALAEHLPAKGKLDGRAASKPTIDSHAGIEERMGTYVRFSQGTSTFDTINDAKAVPLYQTKSGLRVWYVRDSATAPILGTRRCSLIVQRPTP